MADSTILRQAQGPRPNPLGIANVSAKPKSKTYKPVNEDYTRRSSQLASPLRGRLVFASLGTPAVNSNLRKCVTMHLKESTRTIGKIPTQNNHSPDHVYIPFHNPSD